MLRLRRMVALLLLVIWMPAVSHCLIEEALVPADSGCCDSGGGSTPDHSGCATCFTVEKGQARAEPILLLALSHEVLFSAIPRPADTLRLPVVFRQPDETPPVSPAELILQSTTARPVRGPSAV
jgi:hypothetical protein